MNQWAERTMREMGWLPASEITPSMVRGIFSDDITTSILHDGLPEFVNPDQADCINASSWEDAAKTLPHVFSDSWAIPSGLRDEYGRTVAMDLRNMVADRYASDATACAGTLIRSVPDMMRHENLDWAPAGALFALIYDGGPLAPYLNPSYGSRPDSNAMQEFLAARHLCKMDEVAHWWCWICDTSIAYDAPSQWRPAVDQAEPDQMTRMANMLRSVGVNETHLDGSVEDAASMEASSVNNEGILAQLKFLMDKSYSVEEILNEIAEETEADGMESFDKRQAILAIKKGGHLGDWQLSTDQGGCPVGHLRYINEKTGSSFLVENSTLKING